MSRKINNVFDVVKWRLCCGCGACKAVCENGNVTLTNFVDAGIRPVSKEQCENCGKCLQVCPGVHYSSYNEYPRAEPANSSIGPFLEVWEGYASDQELRFNASSGGVATAIASYCLDNEGFAGIFHTKTAEKKWINETVCSTTTQEVKSGTGSRYAPASPCERLLEVFNGKKNVFIGKPCDIAGLRNAQVLEHHKSDGNVLAIGIFCAGTPSSAATLKLVEENGLNVDAIEKLVYRGNGWPGFFQCQSEGKNIEIPYEKAWSFLQRYRPLRCYLCADGTSETADISCGDAWYLKDREHTGTSMIIVRNEKGKRILEGAIKMGYLVAKRMDLDNVYASQPQLYRKQKEFWGRVAVYKLFGIPCPSLSNWPSFRNWLTLPFWIKIKSITSTTKRIVTRKLYKPLTVQ